MGVNIKYFFLNNYFFYIFYLQVRNLTGFSGDDFEDFIGDWGDPRDLKLSSFGFRRENFESYLKGLAEGPEMIEHVESLDLSYNLLVVFKLLF